MQTGIVRKEYAMTQAQIYYMLMLNSVLVASVLVIAIFSTKSYNVLVQQAAPTKPSTKKIDVVEVSIPRQQIQEYYLAYVRAGYDVKSSKGVKNGRLTLVMEKPLNESYYR